MSKDTHIMWFRQDIRLSDNLALIAASKGANVLPIYILDDENAKEWQMGSASRWWLHYALNNLNEQLDDQLQVYKGCAQSILADLIEQHDVKGVFWNRCYEPWRVKRDTKIKKMLEAKKIITESFCGSLLWEPWQVHKADGTPYKVFTQFYRKGCLSAPPPPKPKRKPNLCFGVLDSGPGSIENLNLLPPINWDKPLEPHWDISEKGAKKCLEQFIKHGLSDYKEGRNFPAKQNVSRLSPYLHWGMISPNTVWHAIKSLGNNTNIDHFLSELGWREFSYHLMYHFPTLPNKNLNAKFDKFPWHQDKKPLKAWQKGQTGIPIVDAGMRELWQTGYMHNRVRMIVASFLVKNMLLHWHEGEQWFWDCLVDADLASNSASWQWVAGSGADAAPYFRIFNPVLQGQKFDPDGEYTKKYVPELQNLDKKYLFNPWEAPLEVLEQAGIILGTTYPKPIVDLKVSREAALEAFKTLKN